MKTLNIRKLNKQPLSVASGIVMLIVSVICAIMIVSLVRTFGYNMNIRQISLFATLMMVIVMSGGMQFVLCESMCKDNVKASTFAIVIMAVFVCAFSSYSCAGAFKDLLPAALLYCVYGFVTGVMLAGVTVGLMHVSVILAISMFGCTGYKEDYRENVEENS